MKFLSVVVAADEVGELRQKPYSSEAGAVRVGLIEQIERGALRNPLVRKRKDER